MSDVQTENSSLIERNNGAVVFALCEHDSLLLPMKWIDGFRKVAAILSACFLFADFKQGL